MFYVEGGEVHVVVMFFHEVKWIVFSHQNGTSHHGPETMWKQITPKLATIILASWISSPESNK